MSEPSEFEVGKEYYVKYENGNNRAVLLECTNIASFERFFFRDRQQPSNSFRFDRRKVDVWWRPTYHTAIGQYLYTGDKVKGEGYWKKIGAITEIEPLVPEKGFFSKMFSLNRRREPYAPLSQSFDSKKWKKMKF